MVRSGKGGNKEYTRRAALRVCGLHAPQSSLSLLSLLSSIPLPTWKYFTSLIFNGCKVISREDMAPLHLQHHQLPLTTALPWLMPCCEIWFKELTIPE